MMNIKKFAAVVKNPRTTAKWIENQILFYLYDDERLAILVSSEKVSSVLLELVWKITKSTAVILNLAKNIRTDYKVLHAIAETVAQNNRGWNQEFREEIIKALCENPSTPNSAYKYIGKEECSDETEEEWYEESDDYYDYDWDAYVYEEYFEEELDAGYCYEGECEEPQDDDDYYEDENEESLDDDFAEYNEDDCEEDTSQVFYEEDWKSVDSEK